MDLGNIITMEDKHLNIFFSYNRDNQLIENNMTRAFIVTMEIVSQELKIRFLSRLLEPDIDFKALSKDKNICFAMQDKLPVSRINLKKIPNKYLIALSGTKAIEDLEKYQDPASFNKVVASPTIRPDGWIFENAKLPNYCFII